MIENDVRYNQAHMNIIGQTCGEKKQLLVIPNISSTQKWQNRWSKTQYEAQHTKYHEVTQKLTLIPPSVDGSDWLSRSLAQKM